MERKFIVIIPSYEPEESFVEYAKLVLSRADKLVVVNDGSNESFDGIFNEIKKLDNAEVIEYRPNHGKGYALKQAFQYCVDNYGNNDIIITADCDGQHKVEDVFKVYNVVSDHPEGLVLGSRDFDQKNVPPKSKAGNKNIRRIFKFFYGINVNDTQTGLRGFTVGLAEKFLEIKGDRFEYEMAQLIFAQKRNIPIYETPITTVYPDEPQDHKSHYRPFRDSMRVLGVTLRNFNWYMLSSAVSAILDVMIFWIVARILFTQTTAVNTLIATVSARVCSSIANFAFNWKFVFGGASKKSIFKYYILWFCQLGASYGLVFLFGNFLGFNLVAAKVIGDIGLAIISYQIQCHWVFKHESTTFYGPLGSFALFCARKTSKRYTSFVIPYNDEPVVYVCKNLHMHGPFTMLKWIGFDIHHMTLSVFFNYKEAYNQYANFTFTEKVGKKKKKFNLKASISAWFVPKLVKSMRAIPTYRGGNNALSTFKCALEHLKNGEAVSVCPDMEYTSGYDKVSDIYNGFLLLSRLYKKETGKDLKFIPIIIDDERKRITQGEPIIVEDFRKDANSATLKIIEGINTLPVPKELVEKYSTNQ